MADERFINKLKALVQLDYDAVKAYEQAIEGIKVPEICNTLCKFKNDHERHINNLSEIIKSYGSIPPERSRDLKGFLIEGMTSLMSAIGTEAALTAMKTNEKLTNKMYSDVVKEFMPSEVKKIVQRNLEDEQRHIAYIDRLLLEKVWQEELPPVGASQEQRAI